MTGERASNPLSFYEFYKGIGAHRAHRQILTVPHVGGDRFERRRKMKTTRILTVLVLALGLMVCLATVSKAAVPMGTAFTYQGHLYDNNDVANGLYDFQFKLYDANSDGNQIGGDVNKPDVDVIDAYFTVGLDFGSVFDGNAVWLEIGVRPGELNDPNVYTTLSPRQEVTPTPYALYAQNADRVDDYHYSSTWPTTLANIQSACSNNFHNIGGTDDDAPDSDGEVPDNISINNGLLYAPSGSSSVGIGTTSPQSAVKLEVRSSASGGTAVAGYATGDDNTAIFGMSSSNGVAAIQGNANGADYAGYFSGNVVVTGGNVGIGTISPQESVKLEVRSSTVGGAGIASYATSDDNVAIMGHSSSSGFAAIFGNGTAADYAGYFAGDVQITGNLSKGSGSFLIDHPLDPANKYLKHSFVESPDMMNIYNGNALMGEKGQAWIQLPKYFKALNQDFRYQLTAIGASAPNLYIAEKISDNRFKIAGGKPGMEVSWQVTGIRHDPYAVAHRIIVEEEKPTEARGYYLHPDAYGLPEEKSIATRNLQSSKSRAVARNVSGY